jgi:lipopolysaccharide export system protein LptA
MATILMMGVITFLLPSDAQSEVIPGIGDAKNTTLNITSDKLVSDRNSQFVLFSGNVVAIYGDKTINSDNLKMMYLDVPKNKPGFNEGKIDKIIATGNVVIKFENKTAYCDKAVYDQETQTIVLTGKDTRIQSDDNFITGEKITIRQLTGQVIVDGNPEKRVNAVFNPEDSSSNSKNNKDNDKQNDVSDPQRPR